MWELKVTQLRVFTATELTTPVTSDLRSSEDNRGKPIHFRRRWRNHPQCGLQVCEFRRHLHILLRIHRRNLRNRCRSPLRDILSCPDRRGRRQRHHPRPQQQLGAWSARSTGTTENLVGIANISSFTSIRLSMSPLVKTAARSRLPISSHGQPARA